MNEVLSQDEIDQLLTAINQGDSEPEDVRTPAADTRKIKIYDFKRPDKFSKEQLSTVKAMHETFSRTTTTILSTQLRSLVHVHVVTVDQLSYEEFIRSVPNPTTLAIVSMDPLKGQAILEIDPAVTFSIIDRLFGGTGEGIKVSRDLTDIETQVMEGIIVRLLGQMREAWQQVIDLRPRLSKIDSNPAFAQIVPPNEMVVLVTFETKIGEVEGMMNLCIPYMTIEPIVTKLSTQYWYSAVRRAATTENLNILRDKLSLVSVPVVAEFGRINVLMSDVVRLRVGDVIRLYNERVTDQLTLTVGGRKKFLCRPGVVGKKMAVQITRKLEDVGIDEFEELATEGEGKL